MERDYHSQLYEDALLPALHRINGTLLQKDMVFADYLQNGVPVKYFDGGEERSALVYLISTQKTPTTTLPSPISRKRKGPNWYALAG